MLKEIIRASAFPTERPLQSRRQTWTRQWVMMEGAHVIHRFDKEDANCKFMARPSYSYHGSWTLAVQLWSEAGICGRLASSHLFLGT